MYPNVPWPKAYTSQKFQLLSRVLSPGRSFELHETRTTYIVLQFMQLNSKLLATIKLSMHIENDKY